MEFWEKLIKYGTLLVSNGYKGIRGTTNQLFYWIILDDLGLEILFANFKPIFLVPTVIRGETEGGEKFINYFKKNYSSLNNKMKFNYGTFEEVGWLVRED